ncbi:MAG TPA: cytochrome c oxidase subunit II transmembrane domain-containing protein, partial [Thermodesulfovibrionia bacterium]|nr:cytochrome c oxidase subunit II transmembrane domain-containing protein [Thermodesulfovibrionia bacterium]
MGRRVLSFFLLCLALSLPSLGIAEEKLVNPAKAWEMGYKLWLYISVIIWFIVMIPLIWFSFKYRRKKPTRDVDGEYITGNLGLEVLWTAIPT